MIFEPMLFLDINDAVVINSYRTGKANAMPIDQTELLDLADVFMYRAFCESCDIVDKLLKGKGK